VLGWPVVTQVTAVSLADGALAVTRAVTGGSEVLRVTTPVVLSAAADAVVPRVPGMKDILAAGKKPSEVVAWADLEVEAPAPAAVEARAARAPSRKGVVIDGADAATAAGELAAALRGAGAL